MLVLGIETSCDDSAVALYDDSKLVHHLKHSQIAVHNKHGGVVPELAAREHALMLPRLLSHLVLEAQTKKSDIELVACTTGPGLLPALRSGLAVAQGIAAGLKIPLMGVNHLEAHLLSVLLTSGSNLVFPWISLLVSGGHTLLVLVKGLGQYEILGTTLDDAAGECLDKTARLLGLPYPGGVAIENRAKRVTSSEYSLPRPMLHSKNLSFSFSGLKTAVLYTLRDYMQNNPSCLAPPGKRQEDYWPEELVNSMCFAIQEAVMDVLVSKACAAIQQHSGSGSRQKLPLLVVGGVAANLHLRQQLDAKCAGNWRAAPIEFCSDNGAMIALLGWLRWQQGDRPTGQPSLQTHWPLDQLEVPHWNIQNA